LLILSIRQLLVSIVNKADEIGNKLNGIAYETKGTVEVLLKIMHSIKSIDQKTQNK
jgi:hypothetical protein